MKKKNEIVSVQKNEVLAKTDEDKHPWDDLNIFQILLGLFCVGIVLGLVLMIL